VKDCSLLLKDDVKCVHLHVVSNDAFESLRVKALLDEGTVVATDVFAGQEVIISQLSHVEDRVTALRVELGMIQVVLLDEAETIFHEL